MKLLVIRHGESEADLLDVHEGRADFALTQRGHRQAEAISEYVAENFDISKIYASTLTRAKQTAQHLSDKTAIPIIFDENLMEFNNGLLAGLPRAVVRESILKFLICLLIKQFTDKNLRLSSGRELKMHLQG